MEKKVPTQILADGRVTVPKPLRCELELDHGDYVMIGVEPLEEND